MIVEQEKNRRLLKDGVCFRMPKTAVNKGIIKGRIMRLVVIV